MSFVEGARRARKLPSAAAVLLFASAAPLLAQAGDELAQRLRVEDATRILDPKLPAATATLVCRVEPALLPASVSATVLRGSTVIRTLPAAAANAAGVARLQWDGRDDLGRYASPGAYVVRFTETATKTHADAPIDVVRLGIREIAAVSSGTTAHEWQMVYFRRGTGYAFYATPAIHEYYSTADTNEIAELDRNDGSPRPVPVPHTATDSPPLETPTTYEDDHYNFPLCYRGGTAPLLQVKFGRTCVDADGAVAAAGYPVAGVPLRCRLRDDAGAAWQNADVDVAPAITYEFAGPVLPMGVERVDATLHWTFEYTLDGGLSWLPVPGTLRTEHRIYTVLARPLFAATTGTQNAGPWVEVVDNVARWGDQLAIDTSTPAGTMEALIKGFGGQIGPVTTPIENVRYDCGPLGGNGGASHYFTSASHSVQLSRLLHNHANGLFVNCSDCASSTAAMAAMLGVSGLQLVRLGQMQLRAIRGIGAPAYTLALWGVGFNHGFSFHHVVTRNGGANVSDACLWVDVDGNSLQLPGTAGYNVERSWNSGTNHYQGLLAIGTVTRALEVLPSLQ